jgi:hypothetical protein
MTISNPTPRFLVSIYKRRGAADDHIRFFDEDVGDKSANFGIALLQEEEPVISILPSQHNEISWLTTKRFVWGDISREQFALNDIKQVSPKLLRGRPNDHALAIGVELVDGKVYEILMPDTGVINGFLAIFHRFMK